MVCPPVQGDNQRALASITILHHLHQCRPFSVKYFVLKFAISGKDGIHRTKSMYWDR